MPSFDSLKFASRQAEKIKPNELRKLLSGAVEKYENEIKEMEEGNAISVPEKAKKYKKIKAKIIKVKADYEKYLASLTIEEDKTTVQNFLKELNRIIKTLDTKMGILESGIAMMAKTTEKRKSLQEAIIPQKEFTEVANAKKTKLETQKHNFKDLEEAEQKLKKESEDILRIASQASENPDEFILKGIEQYAKAENISLLAAKASVLQYLSPEWKEKVDAEVREYFANFNLEKFVKLPKDSQETETLKILCDEGYLPYLVVLTHYNPPTPEISRNFLGIFDRTMVIAKKMAIGPLGKLSTEEKEKNILSPGWAFPGAQKYIQELKTKIGEEEYERIIDLIFKYATFADAVKTALPDFDCDETTLVLQKFATEEGLEIGNYMRLTRHAVLKIDGLPIVLDTYDLKLRTVEECAQRVGYEKYQDVEEGNFWTDNTGTYVAQYSDPDHYPSKVVRYKKINDKAISEHEDLANILKDGGTRYAESKKDKELERTVLRKVLEIDPKNAIAYGQLADTFGDEDTEKAKEYYREVIKMSPSNPSNYSLFADLLDETGEKEKALIFRIQAVKTNPNRLLYREELIVAYAELGWFEEAMKEFDKIDRSKIEDLDAKITFGRLGAMLEEHM